MAFFSPRSDDGAAFHFKQVHIVGFSNRPFGVKHFQAVPKWGSVFYARLNAEFLKGIRDVGEDAAGQSFGTMPPLLTYPMEIDAVASNPTS